MAQRVVFLAGRRTFLLHGDPEVDDSRWLTNSDAGTNLPSVLPLFLKEGWSIESVVALPHYSTVAGSEGPYALVILKSPDSQQSAQPASPSLP